MPNFSFPHYRSKRKFEKIPGQRVAGGLSNVSLAKGKKAAHSGLKAPPCSLYVRKNPDRGSLRLTKSKFLPRCQNPQFCGFAPRGKLVGECLPQTLLCALAGEKTENSFCYFPKSCPMGEVESFLPQTQKNFCYFPKSSAMKGVERFLRPK